MLSFEYKQTVFIIKSKTNSFTSEITLSCDSILFRVDQITHFISSIRVQEKNAVVNALE